MTNLGARPLAALIALGLAATPAPARAGNATSNLNVTATVAATCTIAAGALAFGAYDPIAGAQVDGTATVTVACTRGAVASITLGQGQQPDTGSTDLAPLRRMASGASRLSYTLYSDAARTIPWGGTALTGVPYLAATSAATALTVYGRIAGNQDVPAGSYADAVVATIAF